MAILGNRAQHHGVSDVEDKILHASAAATLTVRDQVVIADSTSAAFAITLPPVAEAQGLIFTIDATVGATNTVTVQDQDDSVDWTDISLDANLDACCVRSDGRRWMVLCDMYT
jgi:hypothetical protein